MHELTGDRKTVEILLRDTVKHLEQSSAAPKAGAKAASTRKPSKKSAEEREVAIALKEGLGRIKGKGKTGARAATTKKVKPPTAERAIETPFTPRDQAIALFQSAMDEYLDKTVGPSGPSPATKKTARSASTRKRTTTKRKAAITDFYKGKAGSAAKAADIFAQYGNMDPRWVSVVTEKAKLMFKGKRKFITHKSTSDFRFDMDNETTVAVVGDWGGGNAAAQEVAKQIAKLNPSHVIHLGDVYYSGTPKEVKERFLRFWPKPKEPGHSLALNSNHEMYSGGYGYFDETLKQFKQPASYFSLANDHWRLIGLDTGYDEHALKDPQAQWLKAQLTGNQKNVLFSHHQLFSAYEKTDSSKLRAKVQPLLSKIYGWIWGHEHLAIVYEPNEGMKGICLGNGCFPYDFPKGKPSIKVKWIDKRQSTDKHYPGGHTFALLKLKGPQIVIDFIDYKGNVGFTETWN